MGDVGVMRLTAEIVFCAFAICWRWRSAANASAALFLFAFRLSILNCSGVFGAIVSASTGLETVRLQMV